MIEVINTSGTSRSFGPVYIFDSTGKLKFVGGGGGGSASWGSITGTLSDQLDLQSALDAKFDNPTGTTSQYIRGDGSLATLPTSSAVWGSITGTLSSQTDLQAALDAKFDLEDINPICKLAENINKGQAVYISGATGTNMIVSKASNAAESTSSKTFGLLSATGVTNDQIRVITSGFLAGFNTDAASAAGDPVWLGTNGNLIYGLANKPYAPAHLVFIGIVTRKHAVNGEIYIKVQNGFELDELHNVDARNPSNSDGIFYNSATSLWEHKSIATVLGYTPYSAANPDGYITSSALTGYLTAATAASTYYPLTNPSSYISGITSLMVTTALGYTPYSNANPSGYITSSALSPYLTSATAASTYQPIGSYQSALSGTGFVKISGTTISYDNTSYYPASNPANFASGTVTSVAALTLGTSGTDLSSSVANGTTTPVITLNVPTASASNRGVLSSTDWSTFNSKQNAITVTNSGTSGAATLVGSTLNIPIYGSPVYAKNTTTYTSVGTGTQALTSLLIPANTFVAGDILRISARFIKTGTSNSCQANILINTSASVSGGTVIKASVMTATQIGAGVQGQIVIVASNSSQYGWTPTTANSDFSPSTGAFQTGINTNWGANQYIIFSGNPSGTDSLSLISYFIEKL